METNPLNLTHLERCIANLVGIANQYGWNGVENSKILETFFKQLLADKDEKIRRLDLALCQMRYWAKQQGYHQSEVPDPEKLYGDKEILDMLADAHEFDDLGNEDINSLAGEIASKEWEADPVKYEPVLRQAYRVALRQAIVRNYAPKTETEANVSEH
jgi:hypothetical protein